MPRTLPFLCCERRGRENHVRKSCQRKQSWEETLNPGPPWGWHLSWVTMHCVRASGSTRGREGGSQAGTSANRACIRGILASPALLNWWLSSSLLASTQAPTAWQSQDTAAFCSHVSISWLLLSQSRGSPCLFCPLSP